MSTVTKRRYNGESRKAQSSALRERVLAAAKKLFARHGIDRATIEDVAAAAGVSAATVYSAYKSKAGILEALIERTFFGEAYAAVAVQLKTTSDPIELLAITAEISRVIFDTEKAEIGLIRGASFFSAELKRVEAEFEATRRDLQKSRAKLLVKTFPAAQKLGLQKVRDVMWMLTGRDMYRMFVMERGWSSDEYQAWLTKTLIQTLTVE